MRVCDICESEEGVCRYRITKMEGAEQRTVTVDVCRPNPHTLEEIVAAAPVPRRGRKAARPVVSLDEVAAKKKPAAKRASKKAVSTSRRK